MLRANERDGGQTGRNGYILLIVSVGLFVMLVVALLLVHVLSRKQDRDSEKRKPSENTVWRVSEAKGIYENGALVFEYRFKYDDKGREIFREEQRKVKGEVKNTTTRETIYFPGGCGIRRVTTGEHTEESFFVTDPLIYRKQDPIESYTVDESGRLTEVRCREVRYTINTWYFDSEGRPRELWHNAARENERGTSEYQYDDSGRISRITVSDATGSYVIDIVYDGEKRTVRYSRENGYVYQEKEYDGWRLIRNSAYDGKGAVILESKYYFPKGDFPSRELTGTWLSSNEEEAYMAFESRWSEARYGEEMTVELASDGQPLRQKNPQGIYKEYLYDENGRLYEQISQGDTDSSILYEYDEHGNVIRIARRNGPQTLQFEWTEIAVAQEDKTQGEWGDENSD